MNKRDTTGVALTPASDNTSADIPASDLIAVESVLPHADPMILIDEVTRVEGDAIESTERIGEDSMFYDELAGGVPAYVGIEYIAQTVAAHAGASALARDEPVRVGFLLGTRHYRNSVPYFALGTKLTIRVQPLYEAPYVSKFRGTVSWGIGQELASCALTVYPANRFGIISGQPQFSHEW